MPVIIAITSDTAPAIIERETDAELLEALAALAITPDHAKSDQAAAREWLESLPLPSGWFADADEAQALRKRMQIEQDANLVRAAIKHLGTTQRGLTAMLGLADPQGDGRPVRRIIAAKQGLSGPARRLLAHLVRDGAMTDEEERQQLARIDGGAWRKVDRSAIRRAIQGGGIKTA